MVDIVQAMRVWHDQSVVSVSERGFGAWFYDMDLVVLVVYRLVCRKLLVVSFHFGCSLARFGN